MAVKPIPELVAQGADIILNLNASPFYPGKRRTRERLIKAHIDRLRRPILYVNELMTTRFVELPDDESTALLEEVAGYFAGDVSFFAPKPTFCPP